MFNKRIIMLFCIYALFLIPGCFAFPLPVADYVPGNNALDSINSQTVSRVAVEKVGPKNSGEKVNNITLSGRPLVYQHGSFAEYLEVALKSDLAHANLLDANSFFRLSAYLLKNEIDLGSGGSGHAVIEARFSIDRNGLILFNKVISIETNFKSSNDGAKPYVQSLYPYLVGDLLKKLYSDPEFIATLRS